MKQVLPIPWALSPVTKSLLIENQIGNIRHWITEQVAEIRLSSLVKYVQRTKSVYESMLKKKNCKFFLYLLRWYQSRTWGYSLYQGSESSP